MPLSDRAAAMYKDWYPWVAQAVSSTLTTGRPAYQVTDVSSAIAEEYRNNPGTYSGYDPIGVSGLYGAVNRNFRAAYNLSQAPATAPLTGNMIGDDLFGRSAQEQAVNPMWRAVITATYTDASGATVQGTFTQFYYNRLPPTVGSFQQHVALDVSDLLATPPPTGTPRTGQLVSVDQIQLTAV